MVRMPWMPEARPHPLLLKHKKATEIIETEGYRWIVCAGHILLLIAGTDEDHFVNPE